MTNKNANTKSILLMIGITIILSSFGYYLYKDYKSTVYEKNNALIDKYNEEYSTIISGYRMLSRTYFDEIVNDDEILELIYNANNSGEEERDALREELISIVEEPYGRMTDNDFRQLQFVLSDSTSFLRMHKKESYGDNLESVRETVRIANTEQRYVEGFEEGRVFNGYRFEYPLFYQGEHIGCVEISISYLTVIKLMDEAFETPSQFILKKDVVESKVWEEFIDENYSTSRISDEYYYDKACAEYIENTNRYYDIFEIINKDKSKLDEIGEYLKSQEDFVVSINSDMKYYTVVFKKIDNVVNEHAGYLEFYDEDYETPRLFNNMITKNVLLAALWLVVILTIYGFNNLNNKIHRISYYDKLTGVYNRNLLYDFIEKEINNCNRYGKEFSLIMFDIDNFKHINDKHGHLNGDLVIKAIAEVVNKNIRSTDLLIRFGGDEFVALLPNTNISEGYIVSEKLRKKVRENTRVGNINESITISLGLAEYKLGESSNDILDRADEYLYKAKETGRNKTVSEKEAKI
jgi:diguanylate cyclase (GGDEF)-like protein